MRCKNRDYLAIIRYPSKKNRKKQLCGVCAGAKKYMRITLVSERAVRLGLKKHDRPDNNFKMEKNRPKQFRNTIGETQQ